MAFQIVQILYWLALAVWFGGVFFIVMAAPIVFRTIREANPILPHVLAVNLEGQHGTMLAGSIVGDILNRLVQLGLICAGFLAITMIAQIFLIDLAGANFGAAVLRGILLFGAIALVLFDWRVVWPRIRKLRDEYVEHADEPEIANPAKEEFDREHRRSVTMLSVLLFLLLGMILFSANISPKKSYVPTSVETAK